MLEPDTAVAFAKNEGISYGSVADLAADPKVMDAIAAGIADVMAEFNNAERVKKWTVLGDEWLPDSDELTPTSKLKRRIIAQKTIAGELVERDPKQAREHMETLPYLAIFPGQAISFAVLGFNLFGDGLRDILDPRLADR